MKRGGMASTSHVNGEFPALRPTLLIVPAYMIAKSSGNPI